MEINQQRRRFVTYSTAAVAATQLSGCAGSKSHYNQVNADLRQALPTSPSTLELIRYATLAANGHNTQPWLFRVSPTGINIEPDFSRRTPVVDPDDHHLFASLGCAAENLSIAALASGKSGETRFESVGHGSVAVELGATRADESPLFKAIARRQVTRVPYERRAAPNGVLKRLQRAASRYGVQAYLVTERPRMEQVQQLIIDGNSSQMEDPAFVKELEDWIRFNANSAAQSRDGLYTACSGNPESPSWLGSMMFNLFFTKDKENDKYADHIRTSSGLMVFVASSNDPEGWVSAGRAYEHFALQATVDGLKHAFLNQAVEVPAVRQEVQRLFGLGDQRPNFVIRFGYGPTMPMSLRRSVQDVLA